MTASREPDVEPQQDAAALSAAPRTAEELARERELAALFGDAAGPSEPPAISEAEEAARQQQLAALLSGKGAAGGAPVPASALGSPAVVERADGDETPPAPRARKSGRSRRAAAVTPEADAGQAQPDPSTVDSAQRAQATALAALLASGAAEPARAASGLPPVDGADPTSTSSVFPFGEEEESDGPYPADSSLDSDASEQAALAALFAPLAAGASDEPDASPVAFEPDAAPFVVSATHDEPTVATAWGADLAAASATHGEADSAFATDAETDAASEMPDDTTSEPPASEADTLAWLAATAEAASDPLSNEPQNGAPTDWLGIFRGTAVTTALPPAVAAGAVDGPPATATAPVGEFAPAPPRGIRGWSKRMRWSVAISIVLLAGVVAGSVFIAQTVAANSREAQELAAAVAELEAAEAAATEPEFALSEAVGIYDDTVELATTTAESAGPPLAAVTGMVDEPLRAASEAALADLVAQLAVDAPAEPPAPYERGDIDLGDVAAIEAATEVAEAHAEEVTTATETVRLAQLALQEKLDALRAAQVALGESLPATAAVIAGENPQAEQSFRDAVVAAAAAVGAAQAAGGSGDAELLAYADAVTALRADQLRAETETQPVRPVNPAPAPVPTTDPAPQPTTPPAPQPTPEPTPEPTPPPVEPTP